MEALKLGDILNDRYKIISTLGQGGMSNVYLVEDLKLHSRWALKEMLDDFPTEEKGEILEQFKKEARILAGLKHPNLPRVFDYFEENHRHYLVMEYLEGLTLEEIFQSNPDISPEMVLDWAIQICDVLDSLHREGIIYRDMKPGNIMVDKKNHIFLVDFGIARLFTGGKIHDTIIIGTPGFASPEHHGKAETDGRSDIFSLGATMHFLLTRVDPQIVPFVFKDPAVLRPEIPQSLSRAVMRAVAIGPDERFQTAREMRDFLIENVKRDMETDQKASSGGERVKPGGTGPEELKVFETDPLRSLAPAAGLSGGTVIAGAVILGGIPNPVTALWAAAAAVPLTILYRKLMDYVFHTPRKIRFELDREGIRILRGKIDLKVTWPQVDRLLVFQEKSRINTNMRKYKLFSQRGNFEYTDEIKGVESLNDLIILSAGLQLSGESEGYRRYSR